MIRTRLALSLVVVCICAVGFAQDVRSAVGISTDGVRFLSAGPIVAMRVEVLSPGGTALYDSDWKSGNVLDWSAATVPYGAYSVRLLTKDLEGRVSEKKATLHAAPDGMSIDPAAATDLKMTTTLHDGEMGQLVTTSGDLSFRFGDYLNRKDTEAMRLTAGGGLQVKGLIRTGEGIMFPDGSVQRSAAMPSIVRMQPVSGDPQLHPRSNTTGTGTTNQIIKWLDTIGTLGDSAISESIGAVTIGTIAAQGQLQIAGSATQDVFSGMGPNIVSGPAMNYGYAGLTFGRGAGFFNVRPDAMAAPPNPSLRFMTSNAQRMILTNLGDVGVNTTAPAAKVHIVGADGASAVNIGGAAPAALRVVGGTGGTGTLVGGTGGSIVLQGGTGGGGVPGGIGGSIILEPGAGSGASSGNVILADTGGFVGIGTASPAVRLDVNGNVNATGTVSIGTLGAAGSTTLCRNASNQIATCSSSIRYKDSIGTFGRGLDLIRQLHPVTFRWKDDGKTDVGLIAEDVERVEPLLTVYNAEGRVEGVKYDHLTVALINAVQEQQQENALLRDRLEKLEKVVEGLKRER